MGMVTSLKFDKYSGAVLVNEEFMNVRYRRKLYLDSAQSLLTGEMADAWNMEAVYAGCGNPGVNQEIVDTVRAQLNERFEKETKNKKKAKPAPTLKDVGLMCAHVLQKIVRRDMDLKLHLFFGFQADDFNRGSYKSDGQSYEIKQDKVKQKATDIINSRYSDRNTSLYKETRGELFGYDSKYGISAYHLDITNGNVGFNMEAYEALGHGKYAVETSFARFLNNVTYPMRSRGVCRVYGMYELIRAALAAREAFHCTGGNFNIVYVDGRGKNHEERYREFVDEQSRLAMHIVQACEADYISKEDMLELLNMALYEGEKRQKVEKELFDRCSNERALDLILRGYKVHEVAELATEWEKAPVKKTTQKSTKRRKK